MGKDGELLLVGTQENLVQRLHALERTIKESQQVPAIYTTVLGEDNESDAGQTTMKQLSLIKRKRRGVVKQLRKKRVHFEMPTQPRFMRMTEEMECENDELEKVECENEEGEALLPHPIGITLLGNPGHAEKLELNRERRRKERRTISSSRPRLKPKSSLTLIPANLQISKVQKTRAPPPPASPKMRVVAEFHSDDQYDTWEGNRK